MQSRWEVLLGVCAPRCVAWVSQWQVLPTLVTWPIYVVSVFANVSLPINDLLQEIGGISIHDMFEHGMSLMVEDNADGKA
jgi:hypothetical protein